MLISATLSERDERLAPASSTVIGREELERRYAVDVLDAVRASPGITLSPRQVGGRKTISLRGMDSRHTLMLVDGRRIAPSDDVIGHSDYQYGWLPMSAIERIEIVRGPMSALYGSEAVAGVVNLITRQASDRWTGAAAVQAATPADGDGDGAAQGAQLYLSGPLSQALRLRVIAAQAHSDPLALAEDPRYSEIEGRESKTLGIGLQWQAGHQHRLSLDAMVGSEARERGNVAALRSPVPAELSYQDRYALKRRHLALGWKGDFDKVQAQLRAYGSELDVQNQRSGGIAPTRPQNLQEQALDGSMTFDWAGQRLTTGVEYRMETLHNAGLSGGSDDATHQALFAQAEISLGKRWELTAGLHQSRHEFFGSETSPRLYLVGDYGPWVFKGGYGHAFKAPTLKQISPSYVGAEGPHTFLGNGALRPERSDSVELGASYAASGLELGITVFDNRVDELITYRLIKQDGPRRSYRYDNVDSARIRGVELGLEASWATGLTAGLDATWLRAHDRLSGQALSDRPRLSLTSRIEWRSPTGWSGFVRGEHVGRQTSTDGQALPSYSLWQAGLGWQLSAQHTLRAGIDNLGGLRLAERSSAFGHAERPRSVYLRASSQW